MSQCSECLSPQEERIIMRKKIFDRKRKRPFELLEASQFSFPGIDVERALYFTRSMRQTEGELLVLRWAKAMMHIAENITVYVPDKQLLVGRVGKMGRYGLLYPELDGDFYRETIATINTRGKSPFQISEEEMRVALEEIAPYWEGKTFHEHLNKSFPADIRKVTYDDDFGLKSKFIVSESAGFRSGLQWVPDYGKAIRLGFSGLRSQAEELLASLDASSPEYETAQKPFLEAMILVCDAIVVWARRHAALARRKAAVEGDPERRRELLEIAEICEWVPEKPARTFREAVQCQLFTQMFSRLEQRTGGVVSNGRMDQYLYPYYEKDLREGRITREGAKELLECMWVEMSQYMDFNISPSGTEIFEGYSHWEAVTIGGITPGGEDATNDLSYLLLESKREFPLNFPDLAARIHASSPQRFLHEVALTIKEGSGYPKLINDEEVIFRNVAMGIPPAEAYDYAVSGCTESRHPNRDTYTTGGATLNLAAALEMAMYNGRMPYYGDELIGLETGEAESFVTWEEFYEAFKKQEINLLRKCFQQQEIVDRIRPLHFASPMHSCLHDLCMRHMKDLQSESIPEGVDFSYFDLLGYGTVVDSLAAIRKLVFDDRQVGLGELAKACREDFRNNEPLRLLLKKAPRYGNDDPYADGIAKDIDHVCQEECAKNSLKRGIHVILRMVPITAHVPFGNVVSATPNGRHAGVALSDGSSAAHGADSNGPTAILLSNCHTKNPELTNYASRLLNIKLSPKSVAGSEGTKKIIDFIRSWCDLKLWHLQFNIINKKTLLAAQEKPEDYRNLLVRVAGYSAYFCDLSRDLQDDIIMRTEHEVV